MVSKKNVKMKIVLSIGLIFTFFSVKCQNVYSTIELGNKYTISQLKFAINGANWCGYYHKTKNFEIIFDDGAKVHLKNKKELFSHSIEFDSNCFQGNKIQSKNIHMITQNGRIIVRAEKNIKFKNSNK